MLKGLKRRITFALARKRPKEVTIDALRCQKLPYSDLQGFSGKPIEFFPPTIFFQTYSHDPQKGFQDLCDWYKEWFIQKQAWKVAKREGGMKGGTLARSVSKVFREQMGKPLENLEDAPVELVEKVIQNRVQYFIEMFDSIRNKGFIPSMGAPIYCFPQTGIFFIYNGHHRVSALRVLGYSRVTIHQL